MSHRGRRHLLGYGFHRPGKGQSIVWPVYGALDLGFEQIERAGDRQYDDERNAEQARVKVPAPDGPHQSLAAPGAVQRLINGPGHGQPLLTVLKFDENGALRQRVRDVGLIVGDIVNAHTDLRPRRYPWLFRRHQSGPGPFDQSLQRQSRLQCPPRCRHHRTLRGAERPRWTGHISVQTSQRAASPPGAARWIQARLSGRR